MHVSNNLHNKIYWFQLLSVNVQGRNGTETVNPHHNESLTVLHIYQQPANRSLNQQPANRSLNQQPANRSLNQQPANHCLSLCEAPRG